MLGLAAPGLTVGPALPDMPILRSGSNDFGEATAGVTCAGGGGTGDAGVLFMKPNADPDAGGAALAGGC